ncbi:MAG: hypothetical protein ABW046_05075, partial [Actinoplanes sp.]
MHEVAGPDDALVGRDADLAAVRSFPAGPAAAAGPGSGDHRARASVPASPARPLGGSGRVLVVVAGAGQGRTALLGVAVAGRPALVVTGHADETALAHAGLHRLLGGDLTALLDSGDDLTVAQALAEWIGPALLVVDDAHLLDEPSWRLLRLVAHRFPGRLLASVPADEDGFRAAAGLPTHVLSGLDDDAGRALLRARFPEIAPSPAAALVETAAGNPAALVDLAGSLTPEQRRGYAPPPVTLPANSPLRRRLEAAVAALPAPTQDLLLLAATADPHLSPSILAAAADRTDLAAAGVPGPADWEAAERAGLVVVGDTGVAFVPGVLRSVVHHSAPLHRRQAAHRRLAVALAGHGQRLGALLHRAAVAGPTDDALARELIAAAGG